jgi:peptidoglycan/xylan/chitin deacetylase (PgdA/CDA1 family)
MLTVLSLCGGLRRIAPLLRTLHAPLRHAAFTLPARRNQAALTLDDAPGSVEEMHLVLDALKATGQRATFFVISSFVTPEREPLLRRMVAEGHQLGNHMARDEPTTGFTPERFEADLLACEAVICRFQALAPGSKWFRPPSGRLSAWQVPILVRRHGYRIALGDVYPMDVALDPSRAQCCKWITAHVLAATRPGSIVILHCPDAGYGGRGHLHRGIIDVLRQTRVSLTTLSEAASSM